MPNINQTALSGRVEHDPDFRFMDDGSARLRTGIAVNRSYRDRNQEWQEETSHFEIVVTGRLAEHLASRLRKGEAVFLTGRLVSVPPDHKLCQVAVRNLQRLDHEDDKDGYLDVSIDGPGGGPLELVTFEDEAAARTAAQEHDDHNASEATRLGDKWCVVRKSSLGVITSYLYSDGAFRIRDREVGELWTGTEGEARIVAKDYEDALARKLSQGEDEWVVVKRCPEGGDDHYLHTTGSFRQIVEREAEAN